MTAITLKQRRAVEADSGPGTGRDEAGSRPRLNRGVRELRPAIYINLLNTRAAVGCDHIVLIQCGGQYLAADDDAQIVADEFMTPLYTGECDGLRVRFTAIASEDIDAAIKVLVSAGHGVAVAAQVGEPNASGFAPTAVVRNIKPRGGCRADDTGIPSSHELRGLAARLHEMIDGLGPEIRAVAIRTIKGWLQALLHEQDERGDAGLWPEAWREALTPWYLIEDMAEAMAPLSEDCQRRAVTMIHRFRELLSGNGTVASESIPHAGELETDAPRLRIIVDDEAME